MTVSPTGEILAKGAAVNLDVTITCSPFTDPGGFVFDSAIGTLTLSQSVRGGKITQASGSVSVPCDGTPQTATVTLLPSSLAFQRGKAIATGSSALDGIITTATLDPTVVMLK